MFKRTFRSIAAIVRRRRKQLLRMLGLLPQQNLLANYVMQNGELIDKVGGEGQELLFPCFEGDGSSNSISFGQEDLINNSAYSICVSFVKQEPASEEIVIAQSDLGNSSLVKGNFFIDQKDGNIRVVAYDGTSTFVENFAIANGSIVNVVLTYDGTTIKIYNNASLLAEDNSTLSGFNSRVNVDFHVGRSGHTSVFRYTNTEIWNLKTYKRALTLPEITAMLTGNPPIDYTMSAPLIGHAYGFKSDGKVITGTPSNATCFDGLCNYNTEEGYNVAPDGNNNLVIPQSHTDPTKDVLGAELVDFLGGNAIAPYCKVDFEQVGIDIFDRTKTLYNEIDTTTYEGFDPAHVYRWNATELMRGVEWIKSLQPDWHIFMKLRDEDKTLEQFTVYRSGYNNALSFDGIDDYVLFEGVDVIIDASIRVNIADSGWQILTLAEAISNNIFYQSGSTAYLGRGETVYTECLIDYAILISANKTYTYNLNGSGQMVIDSGDVLASVSRISNGDFSDGSNSWALVNDIEGYSNTEVVDGVLMMTSGNNKYAITTPHVLQNLLFSNTSKWRFTFDVKGNIGEIITLEIQTDSIIVKNFTLTKNNEWETIVYEEEFVYSGNHRFFFHPINGTNLGTIFYLDNINVDAIFSSCNGTIHGAEWAFDEDATPTGETTYAKLTKILKATKDKVTDVTDYALYINSNSAMLNQNGVPAEVGDTVSKIHSISNELIVSQTDETKQPMLQADGSLLFDGVDDGLKVSALQSFNDDITVLAWVKFDDINSTISDWFLGNYNDDSGEWLMLWKDNTMFKFEVDDDVDKKTTEFSSSGYSSNEYILLCGTLDRTSNLMCLNINGVNVNSLNTTGLGDVTSTTPITIGKDALSDRYYHQGGIGEVIIDSKKAWSESEILTYYNKTKSKYGL